MRELRPEYYSDTEDRVTYVLDAPRLEYHLESITSRNQTHDFEIFCRRLCERTICPNLRAHTGPDGGGDSKADAETYSVAEEIATLFYVGDLRSAKERWAFAFSAKEKWSAKVRDDVKGIAETHRDYKKIIFVTSRFARDKDRARIEDELSSEYGIPVTIHDRSWIIKEIIENDRKDIAYNYLKVGEEKSDPLNLGPTDYSRARQLRDIENSIDTPDAFKGMERQRVTESLLAAQLSRNMECPRIETDGRFYRAIRLAEADGTFLQELEAKYERIWTGFWWFDDFQLLKNSYEEFEKLVITSNDSKKLEFLCNLLQILFNSVIHNHMSREESRLEERIATLQEALERIVKNRDRPNNSLEAQTSFLIVRMNQAVLDRADDELSNIWNGFSAVLKKAKGLGEFKADRLIQMIDVVGNIAGNDPEYNNLVEETAAFVSDRKSEAEGALVLLKRAQKLEFDDNFEIIRLVGKAVIGLTKKEYASDLIEALQLLMLAYRSAGLLWAARASCAFLAASLVMEGEEDNELPVSFIPTMKIWAWIALQLCHIPDFLIAIQLLNGAVSTLPLTDESKKKIGADIQELDMALGSVFLNLDESNLCKLTSLPDILETLGLSIARSALLYTLGHIGTLRKNGSLPESESDEDTNRIFSVLASQPIAQQLYNSLTLNAEEEQTLSTTILGMTVEINIESSTQSVLIAEAVLGSLEAFFATAIEQCIVPHTEKLQLNVVESAEISAPSFEMKAMDMLGVITWPIELSPSNYEFQGDIQRFWVEISGHVLVACCAIKEPDEFLKAMYSDEVVQNRLMMVAHASTSYHRVTARNISRLSDWQKAVKQCYTLQSERPSLTLISLTQEDKDKTAENGEPLTPKNHQAYNVRSVIDVHAWDKAQWRGVAYGQFASSYPPFVAFLFENEEGGRKIFERWRERFGEKDSHEEVFLSIIRQLPEQNEHHYCVLITSKLPEESNPQSNQVIIMGSRSLVMEPDNSVNLDNFLKLYYRFGAFFILPAFLSNVGQPELAFDLAILKRDLTIKVAENIDEYDIEAMALGPRGFL